MFPIVSVSTYSHNFSLLDFRSPALFIFKNPFVNFVLKLSLAFLPKVSSEFHFSTQTVLTSFNAFSKLDEDIPLGMLITYINLSKEEGFARKTDRLFMLPKDPKRG